MTTSVSQLRQACAEPLPHADLATLERYANQVRDWLLTDFKNLPDRATGRTASRAEMEQRLREPPPEQGTAFENVLAQFESKVAAFTFRPNHPRFFAFIPGVPTFVSVLGDWLCAGTNYFDGVWLEAAGPAQVEILVLDWFKEFLRYPREARGLLTSGGSEATLTALTVARDRLAFEDRRRAVLYETEHRHWSVDRAAKIIGLHPDQIRPVAADSQFRLDPRALASAVAEDERAGRIPWLVVANAGATNTGTIDTLDKLADFCGSRNVWFHVDAAYGWPAVLTEEGKTLLSGIERADSITLDPHKWFGQTFEAGCLLVREGSRLPKTFALRPDYMQDVVPRDDEINFCDYGIALTRRFRALKIWLSMKVLGVSWFRRLVEHCCRLAEYAQTLLKSSGQFEILSSRQLSILAFRFVPAGSSLRETEALNDLNLKLHEALRDTGRVFLSTTKLHGKIALRFCFVNWRTTADDVDEALELLKRLGKELSS